MKVLYAPGSQAEKEYKERLQQLKKRAEEVEQEDNQLKRLQDAVEEEVFTGEDKDGNGGETQAKIKHQLRLDIIEFNEKLADMGPAERINKRRNIIDRACMLQLLNEGSTEQNVSRLNTVQEFECKREEGFKASTNPDVAQQVKEGQEEVRRRWEYHVGRLCSEKKALELMRCMQREGLVSEKGEEFLKKKGGQ